MFVCIENGSRCIIQSFAKSEVSLNCSKITVMTMSIPYVTYRYFTTVQRNCNYFVWKELTACHNKDDDLQITSDEKKCD